MSTELQRDEDRDQNTPRTCTTCGDAITLTMEVGRGSPLVLKACGCGLALEYDPNTGTGGPCPVCELITEHDLHLGGDVTHTHRQSVPVYDPEQTSPVCDSGPRPMTGKEMREVVDRFAEEGKPA